MGKKAAVTAIAVIAVANIVGAYHFGGIDFMLTYLRSVETTYFTHELPFDCKENMPRSDRFVVVTYATGRPGDCPDLVAYYEGQGYQKIEQIGPTQTIVGLEK